MSGDDSRAALARQSGPRSLHPGRHIRRICSPGACIKVNAEARRSTDQEQVSKPISADIFSGAWCCTSSWRLSRRVPETSNSDHDPDGHQRGISVLVFPAQGLAEMK
jgi:hypothetical protein